MSDKIRSLNYSFDKKSIIHRQVGYRMDVRSGGVQKTFEVEKIELNEDIKSSNPFYDIFIKNNKNEEGKWKSVSCDNIEIEYDLDDIL